MNDLSIILTTRNRPTQLRVSLEMIRARGFAGIPILVFDDASDDPAAVEDAVRDRGDVRLIRSESPVGPARGRNVLLRAAEGAWCFVVDDDSYPAEGVTLDRWLALPLHEAPAVISFAVYHPANGETHPLGRTKGGPFPGLLAGACLMQRQAVLGVGGFREFLVFGLEDTELAMRLWARGYETWFDPSVVIVHDRGEGGRDVRREIYYYTRNRILVGALSYPFPYGPALGIAQAGKYLVTHGHRRDAARGLLAGLVDSVRYRGYRAPMSWGRMRQWRGAER